MLGLIAVVGSLVCSGIWLSMLFSGKKSGLIFGISFETYMFCSIGCAVVATLLLRIGI